MLISDCSSDVCSSDLIFLNREVKRRSATRSASLYENSGKPPAYAVAGIRTGHRGREFRQIMDHASDTLPMSIRIGITSLRERSEERRVGKEGGRTWRSRRGAEQ